MSVRSISSLIAEEVDCFVLDSVGGKPTTLTLRLDAAQAAADLELLSQAAERSLELRQRLLDLLDLAGELPGVHLVNLPAAGAADCRVRLDLPRRLAELASAVRAGEFDAL